MKEQLVRSVEFPRREAVVPRNSFEIQLPYEGELPGLLVDVSECKLTMKGNEFASYTAGSPVVLLTDEHETHALVHHSGVLTSFQLNIDGSYSQLDQQPFEGVFYGVYEAEFVALPKFAMQRRTCEEAAQDADARERKEVVETFEDEAYVPASYNASDIDFEAFNEMYGRRDLEYMPARLRDVSGIWLMQPEHLKDPFDCILLPLDAYPVNNFFVKEDDVFVVTDDRTYRFVVESGIWSLAAEYDCQVLETPNCLIVHDLQIDFEPFYQSLRVQDRKVVTGLCYPFYDASVLCGRMSAVCEHQDVVYAFYGKQLISYKLEENRDVVEASAPEIAGCTAEEEQLLINEQNACINADLVDLENIADGYDINNDADLFRNDFAQDFVPDSIFREVRTAQLPGSFVGLLGEEYVILSVEQEAVAFDFVTGQIYVFPSGQPIRWEISAGELQIFTKNAIISPFGPLNYTKTHLWHGLRTKSLSAVFCVADSDILHFAKADYDVLSPVEHVEEAIESGDFLVIISGTVLTVYESGSPIFTQGVEEGSKILSFDGRYTLVLFSTKNHYAETRRISVLLRRHLSALLRAGDFQGFMELLPASRYSITSFSADFPELPEMCCHLTPAQLRIVAELSPVHPCGEFALCSAVSDFEFYEKYLSCAHGIDLFSLEETALKLRERSSWLVPVAQIISLAALAFSHANYPGNAFARDLLVKNAVFALRGGGDYGGFQEAALRFMDGVEFAAMERAAVAAEVGANSAKINRANLAMTGFIFEPFRLASGDFQEALAAYSLKLVSGDDEAGDLAVIQFYEANEQADDAILRVFKRNKNNPEALKRITARFPRHCVSRHLAGEIFQVQGEKPGFETRDYKADLRQYIASKSAKNKGNFDPESDFQVKKYRKLIAESSELQEKFTNDIEEWNILNREFLMVSEFTAQDSVI